MTVVKEPVPFITFMWVKQQLTEAWGRELKMKEFVRKLAQDKAELLAK